MYKGNAPLILACSHPNSFFDALIIAAYHPRKMYFLARGDAFNKPWAAHILRMLNLIPIYRISEGKENLDNNRQTFEDCVNILEKGGTVLIFSEGISVHEWTLRPLKKGTARLAHMCWQEGAVDNLVVQPVGINYHSFTEVPKRIHISYGAAIKKKDVTTEGTAMFYKVFNDLLTKALKPLVLDKSDPLLDLPVASGLIRVLISFPAFVGWILHRPIYVLWRNYVRKKTNGTVFYDSVLFVGMLLWYPLWVLLLTLLLLEVSHSLWSLFAILGIPFSVWSYMRSKA